MYSKEYVIETTYYGGVSVNGQIMALHKRRTGGRVCDPEKKGFFLRILRENLN